MIIVSREGISSDIQAVFPNPKLILRGLTAGESAGSASTAEFVIRHGTKTTDPILIAPANFAADGFMYPTFFNPPIAVPNGIFLDLTSGTVTVVLYIDYE
jgi:hypothetical protein